ncbi:MAG: class I SAM-dependent methyltransferase [Bdellovibrionales bacterium]|nr:class I SAM-dependent methyltransferase [Bdellovibrionales bacterium]
MPPDKEKNAYFLGTDAIEFERLKNQAQIWKPFSDKLYDSLGSMEGKRVLEIGCGPGFSTVDLAKRVGSEGEVCGIDKSQMYLQFLENESHQLRFSNIKTQKRDLNTIELEKEQWDFIVSRWVHIFVQEYKRLVSQEVKALKKGGKLVFQEYFHFGGISLSPECKSFERFAKAVMDFYLSNGGYTDRGKELPTLILAHPSMKILSIESVYQTALPNTPLWKWFEQFSFQFGPAFVSQGLLKEKERVSFERDWKNWSEMPGAFFTIPPLLHIVAEKAV